MKNMKERRMTIFDYAPKELSQDAFLLWVFNSLSEKQEDYYDKEVKAVAETMLRKFIEIALKVEKQDGGEHIRPCKLKVKEPITKLEVIKQYENIDVLLKFMVGNQNVVMIIEDKVGTETHNHGKTDKNQLEIYKNKIKSELSGDDVVLGIYYKSRPASDEEIKIANHYEYGVFQLSDLIELFHDVKVTNNQILCDYIDYIKYVKSCCFDEKSNNMPLPAIFDEVNFFEKEYHKIFMDSYITSFKNRFLNWEEGIISERISKGNRFDIFGHFMRLSNNSDIMCECGIENKGDKWYFKFSLVDIPCSIEFKTDSLKPGRTLKIQYDVNGRLNDKQDDETKENIMKSREEVHSKIMTYFKNKFKDAKTVCYDLNGIHFDLEYKEKTLDEINRSGSKGTADKKGKKGCQEIGTIKFNEEGEITVGYFENKLIPSIICILQDIKNNTVE